MTISDRLRKAMKDAGFESQKDLERASGVTQPTINRILNRPGSKGPESETVKQLARACKVEFAWLNEGFTSDGVRQDADAPEVPEADLQFAKRLKAAREGAGFSQTDLAIRMNISPQGVHKWESGASSPRFSRLYELASVLGIPVSLLLPDDPLALPLIDVADMRLRVLASRIAALSLEKQRAISVILEVSLY